MSIRLKSGVDPEVLRQFGFKTGKEWADRGERCLEGIGYEYQHNWYHKFAMNPDDPEKIYYADEDYDQPLVEITFRTGDFNDLYIECVPSGTYHIGGSDLDIIGDTLYDLFNAGIIEKY